MLKPVAMYRIIGVNTILVFKQLSLLLRGKLLVAVNDGISSLPDAECTGTWILLEYQHKIHDKKLFVDLISTSLSVSFGFISNESGLPPLTEYLVCGTSVWDLWICSRALSFFPILETSFWLSVTVHYKVRYF